MPASAWIPTDPTGADLPRTSPQAVREALRASREIALIDVRHEHDHAQAHPLFAAQFERERLVDELPWRLPRRNVPVVVFDAGQGWAAPVARQLRALGYSDVSLLDDGQGEHAADAPDGLAAWARSGGELFRDVNVPSKAFGELVEHLRGTPSLPAEAVRALLDAHADVVVLDARRFDEYQTMSIPGGISVPGADLLLRVRALAPDPATQVIVNCAGRTRSLIGAQSLRNAGIPNPVAALRNGTIGWTLAGLTLEHGQTRRGDHHAPIPTQALADARAAAQSLAERAGAQRLTAAALDPAGAGADLSADRTVYRYDVRSAEEHAAGHLPGFRHAPGGQLVQETDVYAPVRGARIVLSDGPAAAAGEGSRTASAGVRAPMTAHWLAQMGWDVAWLDGVPAERFSQTVTLSDLTIPAPRSPHRYRRPYEGTDNPQAAMQAYLDWEYGLVAQLGRDGTHRFHVL